MPAIAQEAQSGDEPIEEIVTTGTVLKRADNEALPVSIMTDEDMEIRGLNTISEVALRLPQNNAGTITNNWNVGFNFATGATAPALRGLTVQSTLSVADGMRLAPYPFADDGQRNFVDLNTIPNTIVERVEVLRDGASSTYGADAIAGVVNVITKKEIQGFHFNGYGGWSQDGGGEEQGIDLSWGQGDLGGDGYNFYVAAEYKNQEALDRRERGYPFNTSDWSGICGPSGSCMENGIWNAITEEDGSWNGWFSDTPGIVYVRPIDANGDPAGQFEFANPAAGCRDLNSVNVPASGQNGTNPDIACEWDRWSEHQLRPEIERMGISTRFTADVGENAEFYAMANFYRTNTSTWGSFPVNFDRNTTPPQGQFYQGTYQAYAPVYVCQQGRGTFDGLNTGCDATNGQLNPYNPYAAAGQRAEVEYRLPVNRRPFINTEARTQRYAMGLDGSFGNNWFYNVSGTFSDVNVENERLNDMKPQRIMDVLAQGTFNLLEPEDTPEEIFQYISPPINVTSTSRLWMIDANIGKELLELSGGPLQAALGISTRSEAINWPSSNPANESNPYDRYTLTNSVGTNGKRTVDSAYFEVLAPVLDSLELVASGRYDDYDTGQTNFSPKVGFKWSPLDSVSLRGSWSEGFRIPSFNEAFGLPTTGYVTRTLDCTNNIEYADFCAAHASNLVYAEGQRSLGLTQVGDPALDPEESTSYTAGVIWNATDNLTITVDYWNIEVKGLIAGVTNTSVIEDLYYLNNGVVNVPGFNVIPGAPDPSNPNALPHLGFIESAYANQDKQNVNGWDLSVTWAGIGIGNFAEYTTRLDAAFLNEYTLKTDAGETLEYAGTLSPCNVTSCSGAPEWRASWANTFYFGDRTSATLTAYYTQGVDNAAVDFGAVKGDCESAIGGQVLQYVDGSPTDCVSDDIWNVDLTVQHQWNENIRLFVDVMNVFDIEPPVDVSAAYHLYAFNPAWAGPNIMGRFFRIGAKLDFE
jgi:iron complex outermembrane receptor protein